jgi:hypothetical protein
MEAAAPAPPQPVPDRSSAAPAVRWLDDDTLRAVRPEVRAVLERSPGFARMTPDEQRELAKTMVRVCAYMTNPDGLAARELSASGGVLAPGHAPVAAAQAGPESRVVQSADTLKTAGERFQASAVAAGVEQFGALVQKVDFPKFVSGLIQNVFTAIVDSSLEQMRAYAELLSNVAKTVDDFARDNISENNARDWLSGRFPDTFQVDTSRDTSGTLAEGDQPPPAQPTIAVKENAPDGWQATVTQELQLAKEIGDINDPNEELRIVTAARLQIARSRQQMLASMVILGINRIVVTDGLIHAKVVFDMRASDVVKRDATASSFDQLQNKAYTEVKAGYGGWFSPVSASMKSGASTDHMTTVQSSVDDSSESKAEVKAKLTGEVRVNFKSDYFPMEKLANPQMIAAIQGNATPPDKRPVGA